MTGNEANSVVYVGNAIFPSETGQLNSLSYCIRKCEISFAAVFYFNRSLGSALCVKLHINICVKRQLFPTLPSFAIERRSVTSRYHGSKDFWITTIGKLRNDAGNGIALHSARESRFFVRFLAVVA